MKAAYPGDGEPEGLGEVSGASFIGYVSWGVTIPPDATVGRAEIPDGGQPLGIIIGHE